MPRVDLHRLPFLDPPRPARKLGAPKLAPDSDKPGRIDAIDRYPTAMGKLWQLMPVLPQKPPQQQEQCEQPAQSKSG